MAEESKSEVPETITVTEKTEDMEVEPQIPASGQTEGAAAVEAMKRERENGDESEKEENGCKKKQKVEERKEGPVSLGPKCFKTSVEMFDYFFNFLHNWSTDLNVNKYEHMMLVDLLQKGHQEPEKKIGNGVHAFQIRIHPEFKSRCFFLIRDDESVDDFSFRKCVNQILPLPENMQVKAHVNKALGRRNGKCKPGGGGRANGERKSAGGGGGRGNGERESAAGGGRRGGGGGRGGGDGGGRGGGGGGRGRGRGGGGGRGECKSAGGDGGVRGGGGGRGGWHGRGRGHGRGAKPRN